MSLDITIIQDAFYTWAVAQTSQTVIWLFPNAPRPALPYISLQINSLITIHVDQILSPDNAGASDIVGNREFTLNCQAYGDTAMGILETLKSSLEKPSVYLALQNSKIVFVDSFGIQDLTELLDSRYESRASMDLLFRTEQVITDEVGVIEHVAIEETFKNETETILVENVTINP